MIKNMRICLSIIVPNYNYAAYLPRCLDSIVSQSRIPDELLICDDASTDESLKIIHSYAHKYPWIRVIQNSQNLGILKTFQRLINETIGTHVIVCASDDEVGQEFVEAAMIEVKACPELGMYMGYTICKFIDRSTGTPKEKIIGANMDLTMTAKDFQRTANNFKNNKLASGFSIGAIIRKDCWIEAMKHCLKFGAQADVCYNIYVAAKWGFRIINAPAAIVYQREGTFSAQSHSINFTSQTVNNYINLCSWIRSAETQGVFGKKLRYMLTSAWLELASEIVTKKLRRISDSTN
jgi:glycosyltransferase involved in cell wall biosynthesis